MFAITYVAVLTLFVILLAVFLVWDSDRDVLLKGEVTAWLALMWAWALTALLP